MEEGEGQMPFTRQPTSPRSLLSLSLLSLSPPSSLHSCGSGLTPRVNEAAVQQVERTRAFYLHLRSRGAISLNLTMLLTSLWVWTNHGFSKDQFDHRHWV